MKKYTSNKTNPARLLKTFKKEDKKTSTEIPIGRPISEEEYNNLKDKAEKDSLENPE